MQKGYVEIEWKHFCLIKKKLTSFKIAYIAGRFVGAHDAETVGC